MALDPIVWALKDAPVADAIERLVLAIYAEHADEDGCNAFPSYKSVAERAMTDRRTVIRRVRELVDRGLLAEGDAAAAEAIPQRYRPKVYDVMIPHSWWGPAAVERINAYRAGRGRQPITPDTRPEAGRAPARAPRADAGRPRDPRQECLPDTPAETTQECLAGPARGDSQTSPGVGDRHPTHPNNPPHEPPPPPAASTAPATGRRLDEVVVEGMLDDACGDDFGHEGAQRPAGVTMAQKGIDCSEAMTLVLRADWPTGHTPNPASRNRLADAASLCLRRGHQVDVVRQTMTADLGGARNPVAVALTRLRELATTAADQQAEANDGGTSRDRLARTPHSYVEGPNGMCKSCGRSPVARVHPNTPVDPPARRCTHGRQPVACPQCRTQGVGTNRAQRTTPAGAES